MVGEFAHEDKAKELMKALEDRGFAARMEPGKVKNRAFYKIFATKEGNRAELEGELLACGVSEPHLTAERPIGGAVKGPSGAGKAAPAAAKVAPAAAKAAPAAPVAQPATSKPSRTYAPPVVEPAPPLPDGYVPPPKKSGS
jgi:hypothetical protein